jgi:phosphonopyruvate decarboxylase
LLDPKDFFETLNNELDYSHFYGVPDSTLKYLCSYIDDHSENHLICANEGSAVSQGIGYHLATGRVPVVYMQNSGFGNTINPILSMASKEIYQIPMLILVGWRGEPGVKDEPQHLHQGKVLIPSLGAMELDYDILPTKIESARRLLKEATQKVRNESKPYFLIIKKGTFEPYLKEKGESLGLNRIEVLKALTSEFDSAKYISSTGYISRELYQIRKEKGQTHQNDFLSIGGMGHTSQIAMSYAKNSSKQTICFDGDGSFLMHMGGITSISDIQDRPFIHIILNNGAHLSVGGQPTIAKNIDITAIAKACGYSQTMKVETMSELNEAILMIKNSSTPVLLNIIVSTDSFEDLVRPSESPKELKAQFMDDK